MVSDGAPLRRPPAQPSPVAREREILGLRGSDVCDEAADVACQLAGTLRQGGGGAQYLVGGGAGVGRRTADTDNVRAHLLRTRSGALHAAGDFLCRGTLLFH